MTTDTPDIVVFDRVQKSYDGEILVVKDLNLSIKTGEFLTMLGPSGIRQDHVLDDVGRL